MRRWLLSFLFCLSAWGLSAPATPPGADAASHVAADAASAIDTGAPKGAGDADRQWAVAYRADASFTQWRWTWSGLHADFATARSASPAAVTLVLPRAVHSAASRPAHLLHTPLLI